MEPQRSPNGGPAVPQAQWSSRGVSMDAERSSNGGPEGSQWSFRGALMEAEGNRNGAQEEPNSGASEEPQ